MLAEKFTVGLGEVCKEKPDGYKIAEIKRKTIQNYQMVDLTSLAHAVGDEGQAIVPARLSGMKSDTFQSIQIFMLDFDGRNSNGNGVNVSFEEIKHRADYYKIPIAFAYKTLSCPESEVFYKFRVAFVLDFELKDKTVACFIYKVLMKIFPEADPACKNLDRIFLGGKKLIYLNEVARYNLVQLCFALYEILDQNKNLNRDLRNFMKNTGIACINNRIAIGTIDQLSLFGIENDANMQSPNNIYILTGSKLASYFYVSIDDTEKTHQNITCKRQRLRNIDLMNHEGICRLLDDFLYSRRLLNHSERFLLETNLNHISGGSRIFESILRKEYDKEAIINWERNKKIVRGYMPKSCGSECPYYSDCMEYSTQRNIVGILLNDRRVIIETSGEYVSLDEAEQVLRSNLISAYRSPNKGIHLIKAQTAIGKTSKIRELILNEPDKKFLIAEPTNMLKKELNETLHIALGDDVCKTESVQDTPFLSADDKDKFVYEHKVGNHDRAKDVIKDKLKEYQGKHSGSLAAICELEKIIQGFGAYIEKRVVVTTHAMLLHIPEPMLSQFDCIIIDEDILFQQIFCSTKTISRQKVEVLAKSDNYPYNSICKELMGTCPGVYCTADFYTKYGFCKRQEPEMDGDYEDYYGYEQEDECQADCVDDNYRDLVYAGAYVCDYDGLYHYFHVSTLPLAKYIVLSATLDADIYRAYFRGSMEVYEYPSVYAKYKGQLEQYVYHSLGRGDLSKKQRIYDFIFDEIRGNRAFCMISFKCEERKRKLNSKNVHFGNAIGINDFKGSDMAIIGTPYKNEMGYKLPCAFLYGVDNVNGYKMRKMRVSYKGKNFLFMSYNNEYLQHFQMYCMENDLEQCIGRARLLRYDCKVTVFSSFPCDQANIHIIDYLKYYDEKREGLIPQDQSLFNVMQDAILS